MGGHLVGLRPCDPRGAGMGALDATGHTEDNAPPRGGAVSEHGVNSAGKVPKPSPALDLRARPGKFRNNCDLLCTL